MEAILERIYCRLPEAVQPFAVSLYDSLKSAKATVRYRRRRRSVLQFDVNGRNILVVVVDCLRADHTSMTEYDRDTTSFLDGFSWQFPNVITAAPWTYPSVPALLMGYYPHHHGAVFGSTFHDWKDGQSPGRLHDDVYTLPERLSVSGYEVFFETAVDTALVPIRNRISQATAKTHVDAAELVDDCLAWWKSTQDPKFAYLHLGDLHGLRTNPRTAYDADTRPFGQFEVSDLADEDGPGSAEFRDLFARVYDTQLHYVDTQLRRLCNELSSRGALADTLVLVTGDHGEAMGEHANIASCPLS